MRPGLCRIESNGNAAGAFLGGVVIAAGHGYLAPAWVGVLLTLVGFVIVVTVGRRPAVVPPASAPAPTAV